MSEEYDNYDENEYEEDYEEEEERTIEAPEVVTQFRMASEISDAALAFAASKCIPGAIIAEVCAEVDNFVEEESSKFYKRNPDILKGICIPTCISVNNESQYNSPSINNSDAVLAEGDMAKIEVGIHIDGEPVCAAFTVVIGQEEVTGRKADVMAAVCKAGEAVYKMLRPGVQAHEISRIVGEVAAEFDCRPVQGTMSHQVGYYILKGANCIPNRQEADVKYENFTVEENTVFNINILMSTGNGILHNGGERPSIFKRDFDYNDSLRTRSARQLRDEVEANSFNFMFSLRQYPGSHGLLGIKELTETYHVQAFPVLLEKKNEFIAQYSITVFVFPNHNQNISKLPAMQMINSEKQILSEEINEILNKSVEKKKRKKRKKKKKPAEE
ncbi:hypothetical protein PCE1_003572 [Barthelona sp. PCE]